MGKGKLSPTQRTLHWLRDQGMFCGIVERFLAHAGPFGKREDLFGFIDIIALDPATPGAGVIGVQSCGQAFSEHYLKITQECGDEALAWLRAGGRITLIGWRKVKLHRGGKAERWAPRVQVITAADFAAVGTPGEDAEPVVGASS